MKCALKIVLWLMLAFLMHSCRTTKTTNKTTLQTESVAAADVQSSTSISTTDAIKATVTDRSKYTDAIDEEEQVTYYSAPDSTGKQYVQQIKHIVRKQHTGKEYDVTSLVDSNKESSTETLQVDNSKITTAATAKNDYRTKSKVKTPIWLFAAGVFVAALAFFALKKYKIL